MRLCGNISLTGVTSVAVQRMLWHVVNVSRTTLFQEGVFEGGFAHVRVIRLKVLHACVLCQQASWLAPIVARLGCVAVTRLLLGADSTDSGARPEAQQV